MNRQQLASKIWESANKMRSKIEANEYKDYILGFIFYRFLSEKQEDLLIEEGWTREEFEDLVETDEGIVRFCQNNLGYFIAKHDLFSTWLGKGQDFNVSDVRTALSAFSRLINPTNPNHQKVFKNIFITLETGLSKLGETAGAQTKAITDLIHTIKDIPMDGKQGYDVLGFIYEYLIGMFAANAGKKAGEFYTPHEVSVLMSEIVAHHLKDKQEISIYDPTSGSGSLLINIGRSVSKHLGEKNRVKYYAQELKENTYNLTRMNLIMRGILADNIITRNGDTLQVDWPYFDESDPNRTYNPLYVEAVVSNPPYSQQWDPTDKGSDPRYSKFGLAPKSKADYAFLLHDLYHVKPEGIMTIILPHGVLFRGGEEGEIRKNLIEHNHIDTIIGLPSNVFFGTGIPTIIMVLKQKRPNTDVLIIDASKEFIKVGKNNKLQASHIKKIVDTFINRQDIHKFAKVVLRDDIRKNDYNLNIPRYVDSSDQAESWDIYATMSGGIPNKEIEELKDYWQAFPNLKKQIFQSDETPYSSLRPGIIDELVRNNEEFIQYTANFHHTFSDFESYLHGRLIQSMETLDRAKEQQIISDNIFQRIDGIPLIDKYKAYQILDDLWQQIEIDLEIIQTEGKESINSVVERMVMKKKGDKEEEVQDGWMGKIIPFDIVKSTLLLDQLKVLNQKESDLLSLTGEVEEILDSIGEEERNEDLYNDEKTTFVPDKIKKFVKSLPKTADFEEDSIEFKVLRVNAIYENTKLLKKEVSTLHDDLNSQCIKIIEGLSQEQAEYLLNLKWIKPIINGLFGMPNSIVREFESKIKHLVNKYSTTYLDIESQMAEATASLTGLIDELEGDEFDMKGLEEFKKLLIGD